MKKIIHRGDLTVTAENLDYAKILSEVSGHVDVRAEGASFPMLAEVSGPVDVRAEGASFPMLAEVSGSVHVHAEGASFPMLAKSGYVDVLKSVNICDLTGKVEIRGEMLAMEYIDGLTTIISGWRPHGDYEVTKGKYFGGGEISALPECYVAKKGQTFAHGETLAEAIADLQFKIIGADDLDEVVRQVKAKNTVSMAEYHAITGACGAGIRQFLRDHGVDFETTECLPLERVLSLTQGAYGGDTFARAMKEQGKPQ